MIKDNFGVSLHVKNYFVMSNHIPGKHATNKLSIIERITHQHIVFSQNHSGSPFRMKRHEFLKSKPIRIFV